MLTFKQRHLICNQLDVENSLTNDCLNFTEHIHSSQVGHKVIADRQATESRGDTLCRLVTSIIAVGKITAIKNCFSLLFFQSICILQYSPCYP